jgi:phosphoadenosine phosphosulfate reductase
MTSLAALQTIETRFEAEPVAAQAARLAAQFAAAPALDILRHAIEEEFPGRVALVSSFGAESAVLLHLAAAVDAGVPVIFLDTGKHFAQTQSYKKKLIHDLGLTNVRDIRPDTDDLASRDPRGDLWRGDPDACCTLRKVMPLEKALAGFDAWITGRKQFHGGARLALPVFEAAAPFIKINPIVGWSAEDVQAYMSENGLSPHPLIGQGYPSIGCWPCTHPAAPGEDARAGRWRGAAKTECGIHEIGAARARPALVA